MRLTQHVGVASINEERGGPKYSTKLFGGSNELGTLH
jgi:hypothetical protein